LELLSFRGLLLLLGLLLLVLGLLLLVLGVLLLVLGLLLLVELLLLQAGEVGISLLCLPASFFLRLSTSDASVDLVRHGLDFSEYFFQ
jgi:hypothetical protein